MKKLVVLILAICFSGIFAASAQTGAKPTGVEVYYFHGTHRCTTCNTVEKVAKEALKQYYGDQVTLQSINREEEQNSALVKKFQIAGQTLLVVKGDKKEDLTNIAFMNAERSPQRLKTKLKETIDKMN
jgi:uncharacterized protein YxeA